MKKNQRIIILSILSILIVITLVLGISRAFMKPAMDTDAITQVSLSSCAKIKLSGNNSINLGDSYPMSRNKGLKTTPYTFTVSSSCDSFVGFNMYIATLNTNTIDASAIHYIITKTGSKEALKEGILKDATDAEASFNASEKNELNLGIKGTYGNIYQVYNDSIPLKGNATYDLYLFLDESVTDASTMSKTFSAGVAVKSYEREASTIAEACVDQKFGECLVNNYTFDSAIYYHDPNSSEGAGDGSYRYSGGDFLLTNKATTAGYDVVYYTNIPDSSTSNSIIKFYCDGTEHNVSYTCSQTYYYLLAYDTSQVQYKTFNDALSKAVSDGYITKDNVKNYMCFGSNADICPENNLYRIIGVFNKQIKLIKAYHTSSDLLGTDGDYSIDVNSIFWSGDRGSSPNLISAYYWNYKTSNSASSNWLTSLLNKTNLNTNFLNSFSSDWTNIISENSWNIGGISTSETTSKEIYNEEINNNTKTTNAKIGLMYVSDYGFATDKVYWQSNVSNFSSPKIVSNNWLWSGLVECTITPYTAKSNYIFAISIPGSALANSAGSEYTIRPVFYINSNSIYKKGDGTISNPYRIKI